MLKLFKPFMASFVLSFSVLSSVAFSDDSATSLDQLISEHDKFSAEHKKMQTEHSEMRQIIKKIQAHISEHDQEIRQHGAEIQEHGAKLKSAKMNSPKLDAAHNELKAEHESELAEHQELMGLMKQIDTLLKPKKHKHDHRGHGAHVHGAAHLAIAFDESKGRVEFKGAAEGILGFEYKPKSEGDKKILADATAQFENEISKMIQMDPGLGCQFSKESVGQVPEQGEKEIDKHSEWAATFSVNCNKSPVGTKVVIDFSRFKSLKDLDVTVVVGTMQKTAEFKGRPVSIDLK